MVAAANAPSLGTRLSLAVGMNINTQASNSTADNTMRRYCTASSKQCTALVSVGYQYMCATAVYQAMDLAGTD
jgi:hypothetical protein